jgi:hypothetical protein
MYSVLNNCIKNLAKRKLIDLIDDYVKEKKTFENLTSAEKREIVGHFINCYTYSYELMENINLTLLARLMKMPNETNKDDFLEDLQDETVNAALKSIENIFCEIRQSYIFGTAIDVAQEGEV